MNTWKIVLATLVIFGAGVITGGMLVSYSDRAFHSNSPRAQAPQNRGQNQNQPARPGQPGPMGALNSNPGGAGRIPAPMPGPLRKDFLDRLERELNLTAVQKERIENIISTGQERTRQEWQQIEPRMRRELVATRGQIRAELSPEQQVKFEEMMRRPRDQRRPQPPRDRMETNSAGVVADPAR